MINATQQRKISDLVYVGFNRQVVALDRYSGDLVWSWKSDKGTGFPAILLDGDRLIVSVSGYTYCLDPLYGQEVWSNALRGFGTGIPSLTSANGQAAVTPGAAAAAVTQQQAAASAVVT